MAAHKELQAVVLQEALRDVRAKGDADAALAGRAPVARARVAPQQLTHEALLWRFPVCADKVRLSEMLRSTPCSVPMASEAIDLPAEAADEGNGASHLTVSDQQKCMTAVTRTTAALSHWVLL